MQFEMILQHDDSCQKKCLQLRLPMFDTATERKVLLARRTKLKDNRVAKTSNSVKSSANCRAERNCVKDCACFISFGRLPSKLCEQSQIGSKCPLHFDRRWSAPQLVKDK